MFLKQEKKNRFSLMILLQHHLWQWWSPCQDNHQQFRSKSQKDPIIDLPYQFFYKLLITIPTTTFSPTSSTTSPTQLPSSSFTNTSMKDYITPDQPFHPATGQSSLQANTILLTCPIDDWQIQFFSLLPSYICFRLCCQQTVKQLFISHLFIMKPWTKNWML